MSFEIGKTFKFEAAHQLVHHDGKCARPHGHSYEFEIIVEANDVKVDGPQAGMVDDYYYLNEVGKWIEDQLDHRNLNEVLDSDTTTAEEMSRLLWDMAKSRLPNLVEMRVKETEKTFSSYRPRRAQDRRVLQVGELVLDEVRERLYSGVACDDARACWEFTGSKDELGYGYFKTALAGTNKAHRVAAWLAGDDIEGKVVAHSCDNPPCINPAHLYSTTHAENEKDKDAKGRRPIGEAHGAAKLTEAGVLDIVKRVADGEPRRSIAVAYSVSTSLVAAIVAGRVWRHVTGKARL